jgi:hypothetical protein
MTFCSVDLFKSGGMTLKRPTMEDLQASEANANAAICHPHSGDVFQVEPSKSDIIGIYFLKPCEKMKYTLSPILL